MDTLTTLIFVSVLQGGASVPLPDRDRVISITQPRLSTGELPGWGGMALQVKMLGCHWYPPK